MKLIVRFAPFTGVALVLNPSPDKDFPCWAASPDWETREERAPHMFNTHLDPFLSEVEMEDEHPFPRVKAELSSRIHGVRRAMGRLVIIYLGSFQAFDRGELIEQPIPTSWNPKKGESVSWEVAQFNGLAEIVSCGVPEGDVTICKIRKVS